MVVMVVLYCGDVFVLCEFVMDYLKIEVLFWKKEMMFDGECWVDVCSIDDVVFVCWGVELGNMWC